ncbi:hypothetical protein IM40_08115 [Candidatus Paracaedimonas acanthamoebae]|nr:hypothetical protein IM40_08115 [Candidatus Paracaedimonas acanthamoebae]
MIRKKSLNLFVSKAIYLALILLIFFSGNSCFSSSNEFTLREQDIRQSHQVLKGVVEDFYARIEERSFFKPPVSRFFKKNQKPFDIKTRINFCSIGVQHIVSIKGKVQAMPFQILLDSDGRAMIASSSSADQWEITTQEDTDFHLLAWPTHSRQSLFLSANLLRQKALDNFLRGLDFEKIRTDGKYNSLLNEMTNFFKTSLKIIEKIEPRHKTPLSAVSSDELALLKKLNSLIEAGTFSDPSANITQSDLNRWKAFLKDGYLQSEYAQRRIFIEHILSEDIKNKLKDFLMSEDALMSKEFPKYSYFLGISPEEYRTYAYDNSLNPIPIIRFNSVNDEHSEPLLAAWVQRHRHNLETMKPQVELLQSIYFLYTPRSTCKNCEEVSHRLISQTPLFISFLELYEKDDVKNFSNIAGLSLSREDLKRLSKEENPKDIEHWKGIVRIPIQYQIGE